MKFTVPNQFSQNVYTILRRAGYMPIHDRHSGKNSFSRKLSTGHYPRFHLYLDETAGQVTFDLHLDQNQNRYEGQRAHNADYDSEQVQNELASVYQTVARYMLKDNGTQTEQRRSPLDVLDEKPASKKGWFGRLFGN